MLFRSGGTHLALASYNAGESAVRRWMAERPGIEREEFIDDIPYQETQGYVKKILGTADDYRRLYGGGEAKAEGIDKTPVADAAPLATPAAKTETPAVKAPAATAPAVKAPARKVPAAKAPKKVTRPVVRQTRPTTRPAPKVAPTPRKQAASARKS